MSGIFGALNMSQSAADRTFINTLGQSIVYDAVQAELDKHNADIQAAVSFFLERTTSDFKNRYKLPGGGYLQPRGLQANSAAVKAYGEWDTAYPLKDFGAQIAMNDIGLAYMTMQELDRHLDTVVIQDKNTIRLELMKALLDSSQFSFIDHTGRGTLLVEPLANGDTVTYPAVIGSASEATENHYLGTNYTVASISDTNDPTITVRDELEEHFGTPTGGSNIVMLVAPAVGAKIETLTDFDAVTNRFIVPGANTDTVTGLPANMPGRVLGVCNSVWIVEWRWMPAGYSFAMHMDAPRPLIQRVDAPESGLPEGLALVSTDEDHPFNAAYYRHRFGFGVGNRLNGVALQFVASTSYTTPTGFAR